MVIDPKANHLDAFHINGKFSPAAKREIASSKNVVTPAKAGVQRDRRYWMPAFAGMTLAMEILQVDSFPSIAASTGDSGKKSQPREVGILGIGEEDALLRDERKAACRPLADPSENLATLAFGTTNPTS